MAESAADENKNLIRRMKQTVRTGRLFHGYIIEGKPQETEDLAMQIIGGALCQRHDGEMCGVCPACRKLAGGNSEDVIYTGTPGETVKDAAIEEVISRTLKKSYTGNRLFMVVRNADSITPKGQNRLLKTLEEPPEGVTIMLLTENSQSLVQTIRSRCQLLKLFSEGMEKAGTEDPEFREKALKLAADIICGSPACSFWTELPTFTASKTTALEFASIAETFYRDLLISDYDSSGRLRLNDDSLGLMQRCRGRVTPDQLAAAIESTETAAKDLSAKVTPDHALKYLIFDIQEILDDNSNRSKI